MPQERPLRCSGENKTHRKKKVCETGSWLVLQASWETCSQASLKQNSEATLFVGNAHGSSCLKPSISSSVLSSFPMVGTPEQGYTLQMESDTFTHSLKGLFCAPGSEVSFFPTINSLPL